MTCADSSDQKYQNIDMQQLANDIKSWAKAAGFNNVGIADVELSEAEAHLMNWLKAGYHGEMNYMERHGTARSRPQELEPGTIRVISTTLNYWPEENANTKEILEDKSRAFVSR